MPFAHRNLAQPAGARGASVALGNFDGLHAGHREVIEAARKGGHGKFSVATFEPPPRAYFRPTDPPFRIFRPERRNAAILAAGAEAVFELPFNGEMAAMTDEAFVRQVLVDGLGVSHVSVGFDFRFGRGRMGHAQRLASLGRALGFGVSIVEKVESETADARNYAAMSTEGRIAWLHNERRRSNAQGTAFGLGPAGARNLNVERIAVQPGDEACLMSDGLFRLVSPYQAFTPAGFMQALAEDGLLALVRRLRQIEDAPDSDVPRIKRRDDASGVYVRFEA